MRLRINHTFVLLLTIAAVSARPALAQGSVQPAAPAEKPLRSELALDYSYLHSNAPPAGCGCFNLNGGSATFAWSIQPGKWDLVGDVVSTHAGNVSAAGYSLTLSAFTAGVRYLPSFQTFLPSALRPGSGRHGALQRNPGASAERRVRQRRRGLCRQPRRRPRPERQPSLLHSPHRSRLPADNL